MNYTLSLVGHPETETSEELDLKVENHVVSSETVPLSLWSIIGVWYEQESDSVHLYPVLVTKTDQNEWINSLSLIIIESISRE